MFVVVMGTMDTHQTPAIIKDYFFYFDKGH
jgi:hypothetical protein